MRKIAMLYIRASNHKNSVSVFAPSHDTAAATVLRCTTGEQPSCMFYTAELVWSFLQRGTEMREWEQRHGGSHEEETHSRLQACNRQKVLTKQSGVRSSYEQVSLCSGRECNQELSQLDQAGTDTNSFITNRSSSTTTWRDWKPAGDISIIIDLALSHLVFSSSSASVIKAWVLRWSPLIC